MPATSLTKVEYGLAEVAEMLQAPSPTVMQWVAESDHSMRWRQNQWFLSNAAVGELVAAHQPLSDPGATLYRVER